MEFEDTQADDPSEPEDSLAADLRGVANAPGEPGLETRRLKAMIAATLFDEPPVPIKIGRFTIVRELGAGGMGVVYIAYDELLDRRVAVKLLRHADTDTRGKQRLEREAQAMARLAHPNVVTVHEVGTHDDQVFVAMEFVEGGDLRQWLGAERRDWRAVVAVFLQAGEGLAAAHEAGLVHRDFKPDNVLVGADQRVRVADFGLAYALDVVSGDGQHEPASAARLEHGLTHTGTLMGTPAYMAPEQHAGARTDARSDQFAFCVALWEGLYGRRPYSGPTLPALAHAIADGRIDEPPEPLEVPVWLREAVTRGLSPAPEDRWPSMRELLDVLGNDPQLRRRRRLKVTALAGAAALLITISSSVAAAQLRENARHGYWSALTEQLLELERVRSFRQATDDALRARDATRMSLYRRYRPRAGVDEREDPTVAAVLLREVEGGVRTSEAWISAANEILGQPLSHAVLRGHRDVVKSLVFAPDEAVLYSGADDGVVWRWELATGRGEPIIAHEEGRGVTGLALGPDGRTVVSVAKDRSARRWSADAGEQVIASFEHELTGVAFAPDGRVVITSRGEVATIHTIHSTHELDTDARVELRGHTGAVLGAEFDSTGARLLTASADHSARLWRAADGQPLAVLQGHTQRVDHARFIDPTLAVTGSDDGTVRLWQLAAAGVVAVEILQRFDSPITALAVHGRTVAAATVDGRVGAGAVDDASSWRIISAKDVWSLAFTPDGGGLITASFDKTAQLHDLRGERPAQLFVGHRFALPSVAIDAAGRWLATGAWDGEVRIWDLRRPLLEVRLGDQLDRVGSIDFDGSGSSVVAGFHDGTVRVWSAENGRLLTTLDGGRDLVTKVATSVDGRTLAAATKTGVVELWDIPTSRLRSLTGHTEIVWDVDFDEPGERVGAASEDSTARVWNLEGELLLVLEGHEGAVSAVDLGARDQPIATASHDSTLRLWDPDDGQERAVLRGHSGPIIVLARGATGLLATGSVDGTARLWPDTDSTRAIVLAGHTKQVWSVAFDATGERVVTASLDGTARIWDTRDGGLLATLEGHADGLWAARFVGADQVITISNDRTVRLWSLGDDAPASPIVLSGHADAVTHLAISPDARRFVTASIDRSAVIWRLDRLSSDPDALVAELFEVTTACLDVDQRIRELGDEPPQAEAGLRACERRYGRR